ncbi:MAG: ABC transporter substrate-binding protein, partial [Nocardioidaceae bacterium]
MSAVSARGGRRRTAVTLGSLGVGVALLLGACAAPGASDTDDGDGNGGSGGGSLSVWVDAARTPGAKQFKKEHPELDIHLTTIPNDPGYVLTKISLANEAGKGWPDVVFLNTPEDVASLATKTFDYAQPVNDLVDDNVVEGFAEGSLSGCTFSGTLYCLRNDIGQTVLWYNKSLMTKFGYDVPQTWEAYGELGARVAKEHPGYVIGDLNGKWGAGVYFTSSGCATRDVVDLTTVRIDTTGPKCARVA